MRFMRCVRLMGSEEVSSDLQTQTYFYYSRMIMPQTIVDYWAELQGTIHPQDIPIFERFHDHGFNLDFPPPAYIGDVLNAPIIILENNGGFDEKMTPSEFPDVLAHEEFRKTLRAPRPLDATARFVSPYYRTRNYTQLLTSGVAALVNGVAYRSINGRSSRVAEITKVLPSALFHQNWLRRVVFPLVEQGERLLVVHRWSRWNKAAEIYRGHSGVIFSTAPVSKDLTTQELLAIEKFLRR